MTVSRYGQGLSYKVEKFFYLLLVCTARYDEAVCK